MKDAATLSMVWYFFLSIKFAAGNFPAFGFLNTKSKINFRLGQYKLFIIPRNVILEKKMGKER